MIGLVLRKTKTLALLSPFLLGIGSVQAQVDVTATSGRSTSASYATIKVAFDSINAGAHNGRVAVLVTAGHTLTAPAVLNASGSGSASYQSVTITSNGAHNISGNPGNYRGLIELNGADSVIIDGDAPGGNAQDLVLHNTNTTTTAAIIKLTSGTTANSGCREVVIRNLWLQGFRSNATDVIGIFLGSTSATTFGAGNDHDNVKIINNRINQIGVGIRSNGSTTNFCSNLYAAYNYIGNDSIAVYAGKYGIQLQGCDSALIERNRIMNVNGNWGASNVAGISMESSTRNSTVRLNTVARVQQNSSGGWGAWGINSDAGNNNQIINNLVWAVSTRNYSSTSYIYNAFGIRIAAGTGHKVYHNSVYLWGSADQGTTYPFTAAMVVSSTSATGLDIRNNIFSNKSTSTITGARHYGLLLVAGYNTAASTIENNGYYIAANTPSNFYFPAGLGLTATYNVLSDWRAASGKDLNSTPETQQLPPFVNDSTLRIPYGTVTGLESGGAQGLGINTDFDDSVRASYTGYAMTPAGSAPDIGADEFIGVAPSNTRLGYNAGYKTFDCSRTTVTLSVTLFHQGSSLVAGDTILVGYTLNNGVQADQDTIILSTSLDAGDSLVHTFNTSPNFTGITLINLKTYLSTSKDLIKSNDTLVTSIQNTPCRLLPFNEDLEASDGGFTTTGGWEYGSPAKTTLNAAYSGSKAWATAPINANYVADARYYLYSPLIKLNKACNPWLTFRLNYLTENNWDGVVVEGSRDGVNWTKLNFNYNNTSTNGPVAPPKFSGTSGGYINAYGSINAYRNDSLFQFRLFFGSDGSGQNEGILVDSLNIVYQILPASISFTATSDITNDSILTEANNLFVPSANTNGLSLKWYVNDTLKATSSGFQYNELNERTNKFTLTAMDCNGDSVSFSKFITSYDPTFPELLVTKMNSPNQFRSCAPITLPLTMQIRNRGIAMNTGDTLLISADYKNGTQILQDTIILSADLNKGDTLNLSFSQVLNINGNKDLDILFRVNNKADIININDTLRIRRSYLDCRSLPYVEDFESSNGGWGSSNWVWGTPAKTNINAAASGNNAWVTASLTANYANSSTYYLTSPPFNMSNACQGPILSWKMRFITELNYDGLVVEVSRDSLNWTKVNEVAYNNTSANGPVAPPKFSGNNGGWVDYTATLKGLSNAPLAWIRFSFGSDISGVNEGFAIDSVAILPFRLVNPNPFAILASTDITNDTLNTLQTNSFTLNSADTAFYVTDWHVDGVYQSSGNTFQLKSTVAGSYQVKAVLRNCDYSAADSAFKTITVVDPIGLPRPNFIADRYNIKNGEAVQFTNLSENGIYRYKWFISPTTQFDPDQNLSVPAYAYINGTNDSSMNPNVEFLAGGIYEVCLIAENFNGPDTICKTSYINVSQVTNIVNLYTLWDKGYVYDSGGPTGNYGNNQNFTFTIRPCGADTIRFNLRAFNTQANSDYLEIFDGDTTGIPLWDIGTNPLGLSGALTLTPANSQFVATSGALTLRFRSNNATVAAGFEGYWESSSSFIMPVAAIEVPDSVGETITFIGRADNSKPSAFSYDWDVDGDQLIDYDAASFEHIYSLAGTYNIRLIVSNCYGADTAYATIRVVTPGKPTVNFTADITKPAVGDLVNFSDSLIGYASDYRWFISPNTFSYANGTDSFDRYPQVIFNQPGCYNIKLIAGNYVAEDSLEKVCYIDVQTKCEVNTSSTNSDIAINRFSMANMTQGSGITTGGYANYFNTRSIEVFRGFSYTIEMERNTAINNANRNIWIDFNQDGDFNDAGEQIAAETPGTNKIWSFSYRIPAGISNGIYRLRAGIAFDNQGSTPCGTNAIGEYEDYRLEVKTGVDNIAPVISFPTGTDTIYVAVFDTYMDPGFLATDEPLGDTLTSSVLVSGAPNTAVTGTYVINFSVSDAALNIASRDRVVIVYDSIAPIITLNGLNPDTIEVNDSYMDAGAMVTDNYDTSLVYTRSGSIDSSLVGSYQLTYETEDAAGNRASIIRTVVVRDRTSPILSIQTGFDTLFIEICDFVDPTAFAMVTDNDVNCQPVVIANTMYDPGLLGVQAVDMEAYDCQGNVSNTVTIYISVSDSQVPYVALLGSNTVNIDRWSTYADPGVMTYDNSFCALLPLDVDTLGTYENTLSEGTYWLQYRVTDDAGNISYSEIRVINISTPVGIAAVEMEGNRFEVYPNPSMGRFIVNLSFAGEQSYRLSAKNLLGQEVALIQEGKAAAEKLDVDLSQLAAGTYLIQLESNGQVMTQQLIITR